jgi:acetyl-CoA carboxylase, biotin carboxylase subunit
MPDVHRFEKVLVANRGEIAVRVMRTLRELGIGSIAVFSEADRDALHVRYADEAYCIGPAPSTESYLRIDRLLEVGARAGAHAVHPGYGFLSERAELAVAVADAGMTWIGPPPSAIVAMGEKIRARTLMTAAGVPVVPGTVEAIADLDEALATAREIGFPVLLKASAGGGGKGMRRVDGERHFVEAFQGATREAQAAFGKGDVYIEKFIRDPKHVEFQVFGDKHGHVVHLLERDCSVQRRHQKVIEETPCPILRPEVRERMGAVAVQAAKAVDYESAGTIEFLLDAEQNFYFLEMNTRLQVEHPVTELCTGLDLVALQIRVAEGHPLPFAQQDVQSRGVAIELRLYAEDPAHDFLPSPGRIRRLKWPTGPGIRIDEGVYQGYTVSPHYDPLMAKLTVWAATREQALGRAERALAELVVTGPRHNAEFVRRTLRAEAFVSGHYDIGFVDRHTAELVAAEVEPEALHVAEIAALASAFERDMKQMAQVTLGRGGADGGDAQGDPWRRFGRWQRLGR